MADINNLITFDCLRMSMLTARVVKRWSSGVVINDVTVDASGLLPGSGGLFCKKIFGTTKSASCWCGLHRSNKGTFRCNRCNQFYLVSAERRALFGHIQLEHPLLHVWYLDHISLLLGFTVSELLQLSNFSQTLVNGDFITYFFLNKRFRFVEIYRFNKSDSLKYNSYSHILLSGTGISFVYFLLSLQDVSSLLKVMRATCFRQQLSGSKYTSSTLDRLFRRYRLLFFLLRSGQSPLSFVLTVLPVMPPDLRPLILLEGKAGRFFVSSDLNTLYRTVLNKNIRLRALLASVASAFFNKLSFSTTSSSLLSNPLFSRWLDCAQRPVLELQHAVDRLFDGNRTCVTIRTHGGSGASYRSISSFLTSKEGRFRKNLLGKRVDYSARAVITVGKRLKLGQCAVPIDLLIELYKPLVALLFSSFFRIRYSAECTYLIKQHTSNCFSLINHLIQYYPVMLNRAPTLHRFNIQAFEPVVSFAKAVQLHPLVCTSFNADFDGDQMSLYVPHLIRSQLETRVLMMSVQNALNNSNGSALFAPTQDVIFGLYYLTSEVEGALGEGTRYNSLADILRALRSGAVTLHTKIWKQFGLDMHVQTTVGRVLLSGIVPPVVPFSVLNKSFTKKSIHSLVELVSNKLPFEQVHVFLDQLMALGFYYAHYSGLSFHIDDVQLPSSKSFLLDSVHTTIARVRLNTKGSLQLWAQCLDLISDLIGLDISASSLMARGSLYLLVHSGARGSSLQMRQLAGFRGLMMKPNGDVMHTPILSSFREGLSHLDFFLSSHGSRKGVIDTSIKTAVAGYLTRRLVNVANSAVVTEYDCGYSGMGIGLSDLFDEKSMIVQLDLRVYGRVLSRDVLDYSMPLTPRILLPKSTVLQHAEIALLRLFRIEVVFVRSVMHCQSTYGVCQRCYGIELHTRTYPPLGTNVGILAAQAIGEPGTQLTMRTFHSGGVASTFVEKAEIRTTGFGKLLYSNVLAISGKNDCVYNVSKEGALLLVDEHYTVVERYLVPYGGRLYYLDGAEVAKGTLLADWEESTVPVLSETMGIVRTFSVRCKVGSSLGLYTFIAIVNNFSASCLSFDKQDLFFVLSNPESYGIVKLASGAYPIYLSNIITYTVRQNGSFIQIGDHLCYVTSSGVSKRDITGGLVLITKLLEFFNLYAGMLVLEYPSRSYLDCFSLKSQVETVGYKIGCSLSSQLGYSAVSSSITKASLPSSFFLQHGCYIEKETPITFNSIVSQPISSISSMERSYLILIKSVQSIYASYGVRLNDRHFELIFKSMFNFVSHTKHMETLCMGESGSDHVEFSSLVSSLLSRGQFAHHSAFGGLGVTAAALRNKSFLSAAAFQNVSKVLTSAAVLRKTDPMFGVQECTLSGKLVPVGTGSFSLYHFCLNSI